jgi:hypothetical protein
MGLPAEPRRKQSTPRLSWQPQDCGYKLLRTREPDGMALARLAHAGAASTRKAWPRCAMQRNATQRDVTQGPRRLGDEFQAGEDVIGFCASAEVTALIRGVQDRIN